MYLSHLLRPLTALVALLTLATSATAQTAEPVSIVSVTAPEGIFGVNRQITFSVTFSDHITVSGTPALNLTIGGVGRTARFAGFSTHRTVAMFDYRTDFGDGGSIVVHSPVDLRGGSITGPNGLPANLTFTPPDTSKTIIDTTAPAKPVITSYDATSSTPSFRGTADPGAEVSIEGPHTYPVGPTATAAADGTWSATWPADPLSPGTYTYSAWVTNAAGNSNYSDYVTVTVAPAAVPVVEPIGDVELTWHFFRHDRPEIKRVAASNAPTRFEATGLPPGVTFGSFGAPATPPYGEFVWTYGGLTGGKYTVIVTASNAHGTSAPVTSEWTIHPGMNYFTRTDKREYTTGETITFTTSFSAPVVVTGTPYIPLWGTKRAMYSGGSGTTSLQFAYQVTPDDPSAAGLYFADIALGGGSITTTDGVSADLDNSYQGLGDYPTFRIIAASTPTATPVVSNASVVGQVGSPITPVQLQATNSPTSFTAESTLANYGLTLSNAGVVSGTPTQTASGVAISFTASNSAGSSTPGTLALHLAAAPTSTKSNQTITFSSPVSAVVIGQPIQLGATSSVGLPINYSVVRGDATLSGNILTPTSTATLVVRAASMGNDAVNPAFTDVDFGNPQKAAQTISLLTAGGTVTAEKPITLAASTNSGLPLTYSVVSGPATITGNTLTFTGTGGVVVRAAQPGDGTYSAAEATLNFTANPIDRLVNLSSRSGVGPDVSRIIIAGFVVVGDAPKPMLIRAVGPSLTQFGVTNAVAAPELELVDRNGQLVASNRGWNNNADVSAASTRLGAFALTPGSTDAALLVTLAPGLYTAKVTAPTTGEALIEVYDASATAAVPTKQLVNLSTRAYVDAGTPLIGGFSVSGAQTKRVLIRAVGPGLGVFGVSGALVDPVVKVHDAQGTVIAQNDNWETPQSVTDMAAPSTPTQITAAANASGAFALQPGSKDAAIVLTLAPGAYTAVAGGASNGAGTALVEVYELP